jgi:hypothetical protein
MHVDNHPVTPVPADRGRDDHQRVLADKVPYASPRLVLVLAARREIEFQGTRKGDEEEEEAAQLPQRRF